MNQENHFPVRDEKIKDLDEARARHASQEALDQMKNGERFVFPFSQLLEQILKHLKLKKENSK